MKGYFLAVREAVKVMKAQRSGTILLNASKGAFAPTVDNAAYASSKAAVAALCRNLAAELGPHGIRVNALNADFVDTPLMRGPHRAAGRPQGHHPRRPGGGVPPAQPARRRPHPHAPPSPRRPSSLSRPAPATPPAPPSRSTAASRRPCPAEGPRAAGPGPGAHFIVISSSEVGFSST